MFASSSTSGLGSPYVFEGRGASFGSFNKWGVVMSWRRCVKDRGNLWRDWVERWSVRLRNEGEKTHHLGLPFLGSPLWFLLPLHQRAHIPCERGEAPDVLEFCAVRASSGGDGDDGDEKRMTPRSTVDLDFKLRSPLNNRAQYWHVARFF